MPMPYGKYQKSRNAAWQCLLDNNVSALPVAASAIARANGIKIGRYSKNTNFLQSLGIFDFVDYPGISVRIGNDFAIFYHDNLPVSELRFVIAHELGHIFLGHLIPTVQNDIFFEQEANTFASRLLAPACVLWAMDIHRPRDISALCGLSMSNARSRAVRMRTLYAREQTRLSAGQKSCFLLSSLEQKVFRNFSEYINTPK